MINIYIIRLECYFVNPGDISDQRGVMKQKWIRLSVLRESQCLYTRKKDMVWNSLEHLCAGRFVQQ